MRPFKKYVICIMAFFIPFTCATLCQFYSITSPKLFNKNIKIRNERKEDFLYIWLLQRNKFISKEMENRISRQNRLCNIIFTLVSLISCWMCSSCPCCNIIIASWVTKTTEKSNSKNLCVRGILPFWLHALLPMSFFAAFLSIPSFSSTPILDLFGLHRFGEQINGLASTW